MSARRVLAFALLICLLGAGGSRFFFFQKSSPSVSYATESARTRTISVGNRIVHVTIADTDESREKGLGGRDGLTSDEGMLFVFPDDGQRLFWMKDMRFSIDILWLDSRGRVLFIAPAVSPESFPATFGPTVPSRYVLELPANFAKNNGISVGSAVDL